MVPFFEERNQEMATHEWVDTDLERFIFVEKEDFPKQTMSKLKSIMWKFYYYVITDDHLLSVKLALNKFGLFKY